MMLDLSLPWCALLRLKHVSFLTFAFQAEVWAFPYDETIRSPLHQLLAPLQRWDPRMCLFASRHLSIL